VPAPLADLRSKTVRFTDVCDQDIEAMRETVYSLLGI